MSSCAMWIPPGGRERLGGACRACCRPFVGNGRAPGRAQQVRRGVCGYFGAWRATSQHESAPLNTVGVAFRFPGVFRGSRGSGAATQSPKIGHVPKMCSPFPDGLGRLIFPVSSYRANRRQRFFSSEFNLTQKCLEEGGGVCRRVDFGLSKNKGESPLSGLQCM